MRHRLAAEYITLFKITLIIAAASFLCGFSSYGKDNRIPSSVSASFKIPKCYHEGLYFDGKNIWVNNGQNGKTWVVDPSSGAVLKEISPAGTFTEAITSKEKDKYIVSDWDLKKIYTAKIENGQMLAEDDISVAPAHPAGAVWNGANLFVITWLRTLSGTKFNLLKMDEKFNILSTIAIKTIQEPAHLAWDGKNLWISSWYSQRIYKVNQGTLDILGYIHSPAKKSTGIAWDGKNLWVTGTYSDLFKLETAN